MKIGSEGKSPRKRKPKRKKEKERVRGKEREKREGKESEGTYEAHRWFSFSTPATTRRPKLKTSVGKTVHGR